MANARFRKAHPTLLSTQHSALSTVLALLLLAVACTSRPAPGEVAGRYLDAWQRDAYNDMYDLLSAQARSTINREQFVRRYQAIQEGVGVLETHAQLGQGKAPGADERQATLPYSVERRTARLGTLREDNQLPLVWEANTWRIDWTPSLIFRQLTPDGLVRMLPQDGARGRILDRKGRPLAGPGTIVSLGLVPGQLEDRPAVLRLLQQHLGIQPERMAAGLDRSQPDWFVPVQDLASQRAAALPNELRTAPGVVLREVNRRTYPAGPVAAHVVGYLSALTADELKTLAASGYEEDDVLGRAGIEAWAEESLAGEKGGELRIVSPQGEVLSTLARREARPGGDVQLALDLDLQRLAAEALGERPGSVVMLDPRTNEVLALVSYPSFDPNGFILGWSQDEWTRLSSDPHQPFLNRPAEAAYPTGSVFKLVTTAAALEQGGYTAESPFRCDGVWRGLGGDTVLRDWLPQGHGDTTLARGLTQSCNIVFYELGKALGERDPGLLARFARGFGFGKPTGLVGLAEVPGLVPDPQWKEQSGNGPWYLGDSVNQAIGQGYFLATPLQVGNMVAAVARGGALRSPVLVREVAGRSGRRAYQAQDLGTLPVSAQHLATIQTSMRGVTRLPDGTAAQAFRGFSVPVAGKTGSAETDGKNAHAWFAGYAPADNPQVVLVVMAEERGLGAEVAAPVARQILEGYFRQPR
ncbi:MAG: penicillin-binding protein 2 [Chloroflexi bacterium]|nr:penicillin-binding protein 2 [Chloroflexota bacterium]